MKTLCSPAPRSGSLQLPKEPIDSDETRRLRKEAAPVLATRSSTAFTLFELLVAMSVIAIIAAITFAKVDLRIFRDSPSAGIRTLSDLMRVARTQAILNAAPARLIINYDETDIDRFLRYAGVVVADTDENGFLTGDWRAVDRGVYLPTGVYVVPNDGYAIGLSGVSFSTTWASADGGRRESRYDINNIDSDAAVFRYEYPANDPVPEGSGPRWIALQFGPDGRLQAATEDGSGNPPVANYLVVGLARYQADGLTFADGETVKGIGVKRSGALFSIEDVDYYESKVGTGDEDEEDDGETT